MSETFLQLSKFGTWNRVESMYHTSGLSLVIRPTPPCMPLAAVETALKHVKIYPRWFLQCTLSMIFVSTRFMRLQFPIWFAWISCRKPKLRLYHILYILILSPGWKGHPDLWWKQFHMEWVGFMAEELCAPPFPTTNQTERKSDFLFFLGSFSICEGFSHASEKGVFNILICDL